MARGRYAHVSRCGVWCGVRAGDSEGRRGRAVGRELVARRRQDVVAARYAESLERGIREREHRLDGRARRTHHENPPAVTTYARRLGTFSAAMAVVGGI